MANIRAARIAKPILEKAYKQTAKKEELSPLKISKDIRAALTTAGVVPCVVEDWANEPYRRLHFRTMRSGKKTVGYKRTPGFKLLSRVRQQYNRLETLRGHVHALDHALCGGFGNAGVMIAKAMKRRFAGRKT